MEKRMLITLVTLVVGLMSDVIAGVWATDEQIALFNARRQAREEKEWQKHLIEVEWQKTPPDTVKIEDLQIQFDIRNTCNDMLATRADTSLSEKDHRDAEIFYSQILDELSARLDTLRATKKVNIQQLPGDDNTKKGKAIQSSREG